LITIAKINPVIAKPSAMRTALAIVFLFRADNRAHREQHPGDDAPEQQRNGKGAPPDELTNDKAAANEIAHLAQRLRTNIPSSSS
jgi:hypothetical protein